LINAKCDRNEGRDEFSPMWAGQNTTGCREVSAAVLTRELAAGLLDEHRRDLTSDQTGFGRTEGT
jgi:nitronate monooxygenase